MESTQHDVRSIFNRLKDQWREETRLCSKHAQIVMHQSHLRIIGLGERVLPFIFEDLANGGGPWFTALQAITRASPIAKGHEQNAKLMREDWLTWGNENGLMQGQR